MPEVQTKTIEQSELIHLEVARTFERRLRRELREAREDRRKLEAEIMDRLLAGAGVEEGLHEAQIMPTIRLKLL